MKNKNAKVNIYYLRNYYTPLEQQKFFLANA